MSRLIVSKAQKRAEQLIELLGPQVDVYKIKQQLSNGEDDWYRLSAKAYQIHLRNARKQRQKDEVNPYKVTTSNSEIKEIIKSNAQLADYALCMPATATMSEYKSVKLLLLDMPKSETEIMSLVEKAVLDPRVRVLQKKGRFEHFVPFKEFVSFIEAATLCYFRGNYLSSCLTLVPVVEGIVLRWMGYDGTGKKPGFENLRKFFSKSHVRQPCPANPLFHEVYSKACHNILNLHLYKPSQVGSAYSNFNRHVAAHLLNNSQFATKENCIRLFLLLDIMSELYCYETYCYDPRFNTSSEDMFVELHFYEMLRAQHATLSSPEQHLLAGPPP